MTEPLGRQLRTLLAERGWTQSDLVRASGVDKNTLSGLINGKSQPRDATLGRIEAALGLTPDMLAARGEDQPRSGSSFDSSRDLAKVPDAELVSELAYRVERYRRIAEADEAPAVLERRRAKARKEFLAGVSEHSDEYHQWLKREWDALDFEADDGRERTSLERTTYEFLCGTIDAIVHLETFPDLKSVIDVSYTSGKIEVVHDHAPTANNVTRLTPKHERMLRDAQELDEAAYDGGEPEGDE